MSPPDGPARQPDSGGERGSSPSGTPPPLVLFGVPFHNVTLDESLAWIAARAKAARSAQVVTTNLDFILQAWKGDDANMQAGQRAFLHRAKCNGAARDGRYTAELEREAVA